MSESQIVFHVYTPEESDAMRNAETMGFLCQRLETMRAAILALAERMEQPMPGLSNGEVARRLREIAG